LALLYLNHLSPIYHASRFYHPSPPVSIDYCALIAGSTPASRCWLADDKPQLSHRRSNDGCFAAPLVSPYRIKAGASNPAYFAADDGLFAAAFIYFIV